MVRWWWPGGDVTESGITAELALLDNLGFGGVEIQPFTFGLPPDRAGTPKVRSVGEAAFVAALNHAIAEARRRGMVVDLTMSSGWGLGGALDCDECGTHQLLMATLDVAGPSALDVAIPRPTSTPYQRDPVVRLLGLGGPFDQDLVLVALIRGHVAPASTADTGSTTIVTELRDITTDVREGRLRTQLPAGRFRMFAVYRNRTNTRLVGAAYPGDPTSFRTIDHLDRSGLAAFRRNYFDALTARLAAPPDYYFVDSFEFTADVPWTPSFLETFREERGYDLRPYLPLLFSQGGEFSFAGPTPPRVAMDDIGMRVREDYVDVRASRFMTEFVEPVTAAIHAAGAGLRLQALGGYGGYLDVFGAVDVPEAEDLDLDGRFDFLQLASSAAHVAGHRTVSNEAFVRPAAVSTSLTEQDYRRLAGRAFAAGINQLVVHGRAYPTDKVASDRWYPFTGMVTTRLDETNPIWPRIPELTKTLARLSYAMTRGRPLTQVAWLLTELRPPSFDRPAAVPGAESGSAAEAIVHVLGQHGVGFDRVSRRALLSSARVCGQRVCIGEGTYDLILVDNATVASMDWLDRLRELALAGVRVVWVGQRPVRARGLPADAARDQAVRDAAARLSRLPYVSFVHSIRELAPMLTRLTSRGYLRPSDPEGWRFATMERTLENEAILLVYNPEASDGVAAFQAMSSMAGSVLDPENGSTVQRFTLGRDDNLRIPVRAGRSLVVWLIRRPQNSAGLPPRRTAV